MAKTGRFWRNVVLIALAHVALIAGLIRWSLAAKASSNPESIVWLGGAGGLAAGESESEPSSPPKHARPPETPKPSDEGEEYEKKLAVVTAKSEIELPSPTAKPTPTAASTPKSTATPTPKSRSRGTTPKPIPKSTSKKAPVAKASPKSEKCSDKERRSPVRRVRRRKQRVGIRLVWQHVARSFLQRLDPADHARPHWHQNFDPGQSPDRKGWARFQIRNHQAFRKRCCE